MNSPDLQLLFWIDQFVRGVIPEDEVKEFDKALQTVVGLAGVVAAYSAAWETLTKMTLEERWEWLADSQPEALAQLGTQDLASGGHVDTPFRSIFKAAQAIAADDSHPADQDPDMQRHVAEQSDRDLKPRNDLGPELE